MAQNAALLIIGNEILSGRTPDANINWIAEKMTAHGVPLVEVRVVRDIEGEIVEALNALRAAHDYVFTTGGIGPTHDDITAESVSAAFGLPFERNEGAYQILLDHYGSPEEVTDARMRMAKMPEGASLIPNPVSGAPGFRVENVFVMAGVPRIMQAMLEHVIAEITPGEPILSNTVACNLPESVVAEALGEVQAKYPAVDIGSYPNFRNGVLSVSLVLRGTDKDAIAEATRAVLALVEDKGGEAQQVGFQVDVG